GKTLAASGGRDMGNRIGVRLVLLAGVALCSTAGAPSFADKLREQQPPRTDAHGDPLPAGALARIGTVRLRHGGGIHSLCFSPDGKTLASASYDNTIRLWDPKTGKEIRRFVGHHHWIFSVAFSPDGKTLASGSNDLTARLWDVRTGKEI